MKTAGRSARRALIGPFAAVAVAVALVATAVASRPNPTGSAHHMANAAMGARGLVVPTAASKIPDAPVLVPEGWTASATSHAAGHAASAVLDTDASTYWQGTHTGTQAESITIDMRGPQPVSGLAYRPRSAGEAVGRFEIRESINGTDFGAPVATGTWADTTEVKTVGLPLHSVRGGRTPAAHRHRAHPVRRSLTGHPGGGHHRGIGVIESLHLGPVGLDHRVPLGPHRCRPASQQPTAVVVGRHRDQLRHLRHRELHPDRHRQPDHRRGQPPSGEQHRPQHCSAPASPSCPTAM
jgi:hypothetical protein